MNSKVSYGKKAGLVARFETYQLLLITQVLHHNIAKETLVPQAKSNFLWKNGMLEYWNIGNKIGINLFKLSINPSIPSFHYSIIPLFQLGRSS
jgi:hypothetical protein